MGGQRHRRAEEHPGRAAVAARHRQRLPRPQLPDHSRAPDRSPRRPRTDWPGASAHSPGPRQSRGTGNRRSRASIGLRQQRRAGQHARRRHLDLRASLRRGTGQEAGAVDQQRPRLPRCPGLARCQPASGGHRRRPQQPAWCAGGRGACQRHPHPHRQRRDRGPWQQARDRCPCGRHRCQSPHRDQSWRMARLRRGRQLRWLQPGGSLGFAPGWQADLA
ncbi:hypothetical protein D3C78_1066890 [compost metagenome]